VSAPNASLVISRSLRQPDEQRHAIASWCEARYRTLWPYMEHVVEPGPDPFSHALSFNLGVLAATSPIVVLMDADTTVEPTTMLRAVEHVESEGGWLLAERYAYLGWAATASLLSRPPHFDLAAWVKLNDVEWVGEKVSTAGFMVIRRDDFLRYGGYDERMSGWAPDDVAFTMVYANLWREPDRLPGSTVYHLRHEQNFEHSEHGWTEAKGTLMHEYLAANGNPEEIRRIRFG